MVAPYHIVGCELSRLFYHIKAVQTSESRNSTFYLIWVPKLQNAATIPDQDVMKQLFAIPIYLFVAPILLSLCPSAVFVFIPLFVALLIHVRHFRMSPLASLAWLYAFLPGSYLLLSIISWLLQSFRQLFPIPWMKIIVLETIALGLVICRHLLQYVWTMKCLVD